MRKNFFLYLSVIVPLIFLIAILEKPNKELKIEDLNGNWEGLYKGQKQYLKIDNNNCSLIIKNSAGSQEEKYIGKCSIDTKKKPYTFTMQNIANKETSLYAIFSIEETNMLHMSHFSSKWRLREIALNTNQLTFVKTLFNEEQ